MRAQEHLVATSSSSPGGWALSRLPGLTTEISSPSDLCAERAALESENDDGKEDEDETKDEEDISDGVVEVNRADEVKPSNPEGAR